MTPDYERGNVRLYREDCLSILPGPAVAPHEPSLFEAAP